MSKIIGRKPVLEALKSGQPIEKIIVLHGTGGNAINHIRSLARKNDVRVSEYSTKKFKEIAGNDNTQGVIAFKPLINYSSLDQLIIKSQQNEFPLIVILDSIQDPHNLGAIIRTCEGAGVHGVVITKHNSASINETVEKTSAGAVSHVPIHQASNLNQSIKELKDNGFWIVGTSLENSQPYTSVDYKCPIALIMGNEEKGIRKLVADNCDFLVNIPMMGQIQSLNVSVSTGILLYEILRQRSQK